MKIVIDGSAKEIAALVTAIQERQEVPQNYDLKFSIGDHVLSAINRKTCETINLSL